MKSKLRISLLTCALVVGFTMTTAAAQNTYRGRHGRTVTVYQNRRVVRRPNGRVVVVSPYGRRVVRGARSRQYYPQVNRARTYRTRDGRLVTILPNGRRIYR